MLKKLTNSRRLIGVLTAGYGAALLFRPATLIGPARLPDNSRSRRLARVLGARDVLSGVALLTTAADPVFAVWAVRTRVLADAGDVVLFGRICPPEAKAKAMGVAAAYGTICSLTHPRQQ